VTTPTHVSIVFPFAPVAKGRPRVSTRHGFVRNITPEKTRTFERQVADYARLQLGPRFVPWTGPVRLNVRFGMPVPASLSKRKRAAMVSTRHTKKPDASNLLKAVEDALNGILWADDGQIADLALVKSYTLEPYIHLEAWSL
jgi:Holliday junction resolvase RusA-like endonuclease